MEGINNLATNAASNFCNVPMLFRYNSVTSSCTSGAKSASTFNSSSTFGVAKSSTYNWKNSEPYSESSMGAARWLQGVLFQLTVTSTTWTK